MARTIPAQIPAMRRPSAAALDTYRRAILELQTQVDWTYTWVVDATVGSYQLTDIPTDLGVVELFAAAMCDDPSWETETPIHAFINDSRVTPSPFRYEYGSAGLTQYGTDGGGARVGSSIPTLYAENQPDSVRAFVGSARTDHSLSQPTTSVCTFGNWGVSDMPLCYTGHANNFRRTIRFGGHVALLRPYSSMTLVPGVGNWKTGTLFTLTGRYPS